MGFKCMKAVTSGINAANGICNMGLCPLPAQHTTVNTPTITSTTVKPAGVL